MNNFDKIPSILKTQRNYIGMTQKEVAEYLDIPYQDYQKYEYGLHVPKRERYRELCHILEIPINNLVYKLKKDPPEPENGSNFFNADFTPPPPPNHPTNHPQNDGKFAF